LLTDDGRRVYVEQVAQMLAGARIMVGDGQQRAEVPVEMEPWPGQVTMSATFGEDVANFAWTERGVMLDGKLIDHEEADGGRKIFGASWTVEYILQVLPEPTTE
jgi:hypothetical protein